LGRFNSVDEAVERALQLLDEQYNEAFVMKECHQSLPLSAADYLRLQQLLVSRPEIPVWTSAEQQECNRSAMKKLQSMIDRGNNQNQK
jgi:Arc/MetJ-type ribon-helix-helix transcriptional regulator